MTTRDALLTRAEDLARRTGYDGFSFADLAAGAGIRKASVHHHFPTKADLAAELMDTYAARVRDRLAPWAEAPGGARLAAVLDLYRDALQGGRSQCLCVALSAVQDRLPLSVQEAVAGFQAEMRRWLAQAFAAGAADGTITTPAAPETEAASAFALLEGAQLVARASRDATQFDLAVAVLAARIRQGDGA